VPDDKQEEIGMLVDEDDFQGFDRPDRGRLGDRPPPHHPGPKAPRKGFSRQNAGGMILRGYSNSSPGDTL
jgi:hypothetical protein